MTRHRVRGRPSRRGIAGWPLVTLLVVVLLVLGGLGWWWLDGYLAQRNEAQAQSCPEGDATLVVAASPTIAGVISEAAAGWNESNPIVADQCMTAEVRAVPPGEVVGSLAAGGTGSPPPPAVWIPDSSTWAGRLAPGTVSAVEPLATSPVVLAAPEPAGAALAAARLRWDELPELATADDGWTRFAQPQWGAFDLAVPDPATNAASTLALQAVVGARTGSGASGQAVTVDQVAGPAGIDIQAMAASTNPAPPASTADALGQVAGALDPASAPFDVAVALEHDVFQHNRSGAPLTAVIPHGPAPVADIPFVTLAGDGVGTAQQEAAQLLRSHLLQPPQQEAFAAAGLRAAAPPPPPSPGLSWPPLPDPLPPADGVTSRLLADTWRGAVSGGPVSTVLVDVSRTMLNDAGNGESRLAWVADILRDHIRESDVGSLGLWQFSGDFGGDPYEQLAGTGPIAEQRTQLQSGVDELAVESASHMYVSLLEVYRSATETYQPDRPNRVVLITDGTDDGPLPYEDFVAELDQLIDPARPVAIDVIAIGQEAPVDQLTEISTRTGGAMLPAEGGPALTTALRQILLG